MRLNRIGIAAVALLLLTHLVGAQQPAPSQFTVYGTGTASCGRWTSSRAESELKGGLSVLAHNHRIAWVLGFVSGAGWASVENVSETDSNAIEKWIDNYCQAHPLDTISAASQQLVLELERR